jgi:hypothetical protein
MTTLLPLTLAACGSDPGTTPILDTALSGVVKGAPFTAKSATAENDPTNPGMKMVTVSAGMRSCSMLENGPPHFTAFNVPWKDGAAFALDAQHQVNVVFVSGNGGEQTDSQEGRVEVVKAAAAGATGTVRLRVELDSDTHVEGRFDVTVCN